jgi:hypothetical protein
MSLIELFPRQRREPPLSLGEYRGLNKERLRQWGSTPSSQRAAARSARSYRWHTSLALNRGSALSSAKTDADLGSRAGLSADRPRWLRPHRRASARVAHAASAFSTDFGSVLIARSRAFAGPVGSRRPCSQLRKVPTSTCRSFANCG